MGQKALISFLLVIVIISVSTTAFLFGRQYEEVSRQGSESDTEKVADKVTEDAMEVEDADSALMEGDADATDEVSEGAMEEDADSEDAVEEDPETEEVDADPDPEEEAPAEDPVEPAEPEDPEDPEEPEGGLLNPDLAIIPGVLEAIFTCSDNSDCSDGYFCKKDSCGAETGTCTEQPDTCPPLFSPVCGCNNSTYSSACSANKAGRNVKSSGICFGWF